ncbi:MAG: tetratricopeptide repeat protein [Polyangiaceae bacterium]
MLLRWLARRRYEAAIGEAAEHEEQRRSGEARAALVRALADAERAFGREHHEVGCVRYALAASLLAAGEIDAAIPIAERAAETLAKNVGGPFAAGDPTEASARALIAAALDRAGADDERQRAALTEWADAARRCGDDEGAGSAENQLGLLEGRAGRREAASEHFGRALEHRERAHGPRAIATLETMYNRATFRSAERSLTDVERDLSSVIDALDGKTGTREGELLESALHNLAVLFEERADDDRALTLYQRSLKAREARLGPMSRELRPTLARLAQLHHRAGRVVHALPFYDRALSLARAELPDDHPVVVALAAWRAELTEGVGPTALARR